MKLKKIISFGMALLLLAMVFAGCSVQRYDAEIYSYVNDWLDPAFLENNKVSSSRFENPDYNEDEAENNAYYDVPKYLSDSTAPQTRMLIFTDQESMNAAFAENEIEVDFEEEMLLIYMFADMSPPSRTYEIKKIAVEKEVLNIHYRLVPRTDNKKDIVGPYARCIAVKMEKVDVSTVNFIEDQ